MAIIGKDKLPYREAYGLDFPKPTLADAEIVCREMPESFPNMYPKKPN